MGMVWRGVHNNKASPTDHMFTKMVEVILLPIFKSKTVWVEISTFKLEELL